MNLGVFTSKVFLLLLSLVFLASAAGLGYVGVQVVITYKNFDQFLADTYAMLAAVVIMCMAVVMFIVGLLGCCATLQESSKGMGCFLFLISIIFAAGVAACILGLVFKEKIKPIVEKNMKDVLLKYDGINVKSMAINYLQQQLQCCGVQNRTDWMSTPWYLSSKNFSVPVSCCKKNVQSCTGSLGVLQNINTELFGIISACIISCENKGKGYQRL
ncbi:tetraspanin-36-like isoform X2 [Ascaphus truei]|uniref:tetraspanin-36-like isoform X2 n=1 Tax=Ascaphus truei TaxID=8439 RepID=UPI003F59D480